MCSNSCVIAVPLEATLRLQYGFIFTLGTEQFGDSCNTYCRLHIVRDNVFRIIPYMFITLAFRVLRISTVYTDLINTVLQRHTLFLAAILVFEAFHEPVIHRPQATFGEAGVYVRRLNLIKRDHRTNYVRAHRAEVDD